MDFFKAFQTYILFRPYGENLLGARARSFLAFMLLLTLITACLETAIWYSILQADPEFQSAMKRGASDWMPYIVCFGVFVTAYVIDASIALFDWDNFYTWRTLNDPALKGRSNWDKLSDWTKHNWKSVLGIIIRVAFFLITAIAAGLGSLLTKERSSLETDAVAQARSSIEQQLDTYKKQAADRAGIKELELKMANRQTALDDERKGLGGGQEQRKTRYRSNFAGD